MSHEVEFGELPPSLHRRTGYRSTVWDHVAEQLRANPNEWAKIRTAPDSRKAAALAANIRYGILAAFRGRNFEATPRGCDVWARYVGGAA